VVNINLTLVIQVLLFLAFMWALNRWVFRPVLALLDARHDAIEADKARAAQAQQDAARRERKYAIEVAALHRDASQAVQKAHRAAQDAHNQRVLELKREEEAELRVVRERTAAEVAEQRHLYPECVTQLAGVILDAVAPGEVST
jgi:F-type H+-transporting ATPase subunit b